MNGYQFTAICFLLIGVYCAGRTFYRAMSEDDYPRTNALALTSIAFTLIALVLLQMP